MLFVLLVLSGCESGELLFNNPKPDNEFNYPYYLFIPEEINLNDSIYLVVEPNNSGFVSDDFDEHIESAEQVATNNSNLGNYISQKLKYPLLVPVFPRSESNWRVYTHALDRDIIVTKDKSLKRIDLQLLEMIKDTKSTLRQIGIKSKEEIILTGFSASGTFANRFSAIHPSKVKVVAAGGLNGILFLPLNGIQNETLNYPLGTNDFEELFGEPFDSAAFQRTPQFLFMGNKDDNDAAQYQDAYDTQEKNTIYTVLGERMIPGRWSKCSTIYHSSNINCIIKSYQGVGHEYDEDILQEILEFVKINVNK